MSQAPSPASTAEAPSATITRRQLESVLTKLIQTLPGASDVNFSVGKPPQVELEGELRGFRFGSVEAELSPQHTLEIARAIIDGNAGLEESLERTGACDCAISLPNGTRLRVNVFKARGSHSIVLRVLASEVPSLERLKLPAILEEIPKLRNGLVLVTGSTGSGKSTTLAAVIDRINSTRPVHVVTLEDPIEFTHKQKLATVNQRELGADFREFSDGLKAALRQAPKVILVGEMRDKATVEIALKAAETGHLVLSTLHTIDAGQTINRITGMFEAEERPLVRMRLGEVLRFVLSQRLLPREGEGRVAALEIMGTSLRVRELIVNGESKDKTFYQVIADSHPHGWQTFDQHILDLFEAGTITKETARAFATDGAHVGRELDRIRATRGENTSDLGELEMAAAGKRRR